MAIKLATEKEKKTFMKTISQRARERRNPFSIMFELTYKCNFKCPHCYLPGSKMGPEELTTRQVFLILDQLKEMGVYSLGFTGGEALARKDIFEILDYAKRLGFEVNLLSNGYLIDAEAAEKLWELKINKVDLTFNSMDPKIFDQLTGVENSFEKVKNAVSLLLDRGIQTTIKSTCMNVNKEDIPKISKFARELGIIYRIDGEILPDRSGSNKWVEEFSLADAAREYEELRRKVYPEMFAGDRPVSKSKKTRDKVFNCGVGINSFSINPYGRMNFCLEIDYPGYNVLEKGVKICWEKIKAEVDAMNKLENFVCRDCDLFEDCGWCAGRSYIETGSFNNCSEFFKKRAVERKKIKEETKR